MARVGTGVRAGNWFIWVSKAIGGLLMTLLAVIGVIGIVALLIGIFAH